MKPFADAAKIRTDEAFDELERECARLRAEKAELLVALTAARATIGRLNAEAAGDAKGEGS